MNFKVGDMISVIPEQVAGHTKYERLSGKEGIILNIAPHNGEVTLCTIEVKGERGNIEIYDFRLKKATKLDRILK